VVWVDLLEFLDQLEEDEKIGLAADNAIPVFYLAMTRSQELRLIFEAARTAPSRDVAIRRFFKNVNRLLLLKKATDPNFDLLARDGFSFKRSLWELRGGHPTPGPRPFGSGF